MGSSLADRATRVCNTCKTRKKACDKRLPHCGYCSQRGLDCIYDDYFIDMPSYAIQGTGLGDICSVSANQSELLTRQLSLQIGRIFHLSGYSLHELADLFFRTFHTWIPVVSPDIFQHAVLSAQDANLPANVSALALAMYLIVQHPRVKGTKNKFEFDAKPDTKPDDLYVTVKVLLAQSQAILTPSIPLVQASVLVTAYEYATGRPEAAWISVGTCIRMAQTIGISEIKKTQDFSNLDERAVFACLEERNVWWAIVILERIIIPEIPTGIPTPTTTYPSLDSPLPTDLLPATRYDLRLPSLGALISPPLGKIRGDFIGYFARHAQAVFLLNRFFDITNQTKDRQLKFSELKKLDGDVQNLLSLLMNEDRWTKRFGCGAIASTVRLLFLIHKYTLSQTAPSELEADGRDREIMSQAALDTATRIMIDVAESLLDRSGSVETMPLCSTYISRVAHDHIENGTYQSIWAMQARAKKPLMALERVFGMRWAAAQ